MEPTMVLEVIGRWIEAAGVIAIVGGALLAIVLAAMRLRTSDGVEVYRTFRHDLGRGIIVGLELLVAADIIETVNGRPSLYDLAALAVIVAIRTTLSFTLEVELNGRWPWQHAATSVEQRAAADQVSHVH
jgi:uncharacterized membrane protein